MFPQEDAQKSCPTEDTNSLGQAGEPKSVPKRVCNTSCVTNLSPDLWGEGVAQLTAPSMVLGKHLALARLEEDSSE